MQHKTKREQRESANETQINNFSLALLRRRFSIRAQQSPLAPHEMHMHQHGDMQPLEPVFPRMSRAQQQSHEKLFTLDDAERLAAASNPTLRQAEAEIRAAKARTQQAGLYPNPTIGYTGDEIRGGSINGGKQGFFVEQSIVTAGKLSKSRSVFEQETRIAEIEAEEQKTRVETSVKTAFYRVLAAQELLESRRDLSQIAQLSDIPKELARTGQVDESEKLETDIEVQRLHLAVYAQEEILRAEWRKLAAIVGQPDLPQSVVAGDLERGWPEINEQQILETIASLSPATRIADAASARAAAEITRAKSAVIPDINLLGGLEYNNEPLSHPPLHRLGRPCRARRPNPYLQSQSRKYCRSLSRPRSLATGKAAHPIPAPRACRHPPYQYTTAKLIATQYRDEILPLAKKAYTLMTEKYGQMLAAYPHVLQSQRKHFQLQAEYIQPSKTCGPPASPCKASS